MLDVTFDEFHGTFSVSVHIPMQGLLPCARCAFNFLKWLLQSIRLRVVCNDEQAADNRTIYFFCHAIGSFAYYDKQPQRVVLLLLPSAAAAVSSSLSPENAIGVLCAGP